MTQTKVKSLDMDKTKEADEEQKKNTNSKCFSDNCMQIAAWILLTLGLCIIVLTFFLAISHSGQASFDNGDYEEQTISEYAEYGTNISMKLLSRIMDDKIMNLKNTLNNEGCELKLCKMICIDTENIFWELNQMMNLSNCPSLDTLVIENQRCSDGILKNNWHDAEYTIHEVSLINSNVTKISSSAFNAPIFSTTFMLYWRNLNLYEVDGGALLGLVSLKYLLIDTKINCLDRAFFQPVQTTLVYLKLHAEITTSTNGNIFGISKMEKLEYVDISRNNFQGIITRETFESTPNLKYLKMSKNKITAISPDAFKSLIGKLLFLDLSHNKLKTIDFEALEPLLIANIRMFVNLAMNVWTCNCNLRPLVQVYRKYRGQFMDGLYCKAPHSLYGKYIDEVDLESQNCSASVSPSDELIKSEESNLRLTNETVDKSDFDSIERQNILLHCWNINDPEINSDSDATDSESIENQSSFKNFDDVDERDASDSKQSKAVKGKLDYFDFARPQYEFELFLFENSSVKVTVLGFVEESKEIHIIWFDEDANESSQKNTPCLRYANPFVITEPLETNKTYTFCYVHASTESISPFNCLPLHVPDEKSLKEEEIWIGHDQKSFTIGMLCLIFLISTFAGAVIAYFGIKAYPDLLEGSKNVLIVKKSDQTCYVSTISEADYMKKSSLKKKSSDDSSMKGPCLSKSSNSLSQQSFDTSDLSRISSVISSSTCFEDAFPPSTYMNDEYEMPKPARPSQLVYESRCIPNTYVASRPCRSPPPLPKRNSRSFSENP